MLNVNILNGGNVNQTSGGSSDNQLGIINVAADFPTTSEANASIGQGYYLISASVTDDDPTKTNTGDSFTEGQQIFWSGSAWIVGSFELPIASPTVLGGIKVGDNLTIDPDGTLNAIGGSGVQTVTGDLVDNTDPLNPIVNLPATVVLTSGAQDISDKTFTNTSLQGGGASEFTLVLPTILQYMTWLEEPSIDVPFALSANTASIYLDSSDALLHIKYESPNEDTFVLANAQQTLTQKTFTDLAIEVESDGATAYSMAGVIVNQNTNIYRTQAQTATTDDTPTELQSFPTTSNSNIKISADILAIRTGGASGSACDTYAVKATATYKNIAGTVSLVGSVDIIGEVSDIIGADIDFYIDGTDIQLLVIGVDGYNITWNANEISVSTTQL